MQQIGHAILGDRLYASPKITAMSERLLLHAEAIEFRHPKNNKFVEFAVNKEFD
jgi:tRNA pseudouridine32 synthase/23S rRNA pseudouridine746 synthase